MLIVADYGQLELRILAHMTNCEAMIKAFKLGGDFHSRTALVSPIYFLLRLRLIICCLGDVPGDLERA